MDEPDSDNSPDPDGRRRAVIALMVIVVLIAGGLFLAHVLGDASRVQDCVMSGRTNCAPVDPDTAERAKLNIPD